MLSNIGVTSPEKSLSIEEISEHIGVKVSMLEKLLPKLVQDGFVKSLQIDLIEKYYITVNGIRKVLSTYS